MANLTMLNGTISSVVNGTVSSVVNDTVSSVATLSECSYGTLFKFGAKVVVGLIVAGGAGYIGLLAKEKIPQWAHQANRFLKSYQLRNDQVIISNAVTATGAAVTYAFGSAHPYCMAVSIGATLLGNIVMLRKSPATRSMEAEMDEPLMIGQSSPLHLDADNSYFVLGDRGITAHSVGGALAIWQLTRTFRTQNRLSLDYKSAQAIRSFIRTNAGPADFERGFDVSGVAYEFLTKKYGVGVARNDLQAHQIKSRAELLATMGDDPVHPRPLRHPAINGVRLTEDQLSGWLMDIRQQVYAETQR